MSDPRERKSGKGTRRRTCAGALLGAVLGLGGCGDILKVESPDIVRPESLDTPAGLEVRRNGAYGEFAVAFTGQGGASGVDGHIQKSALFSDELKVSDTQTGRTTVDARRAHDRTGDVQELFANLHRARSAAESAAAAYLAFEPAPPNRDAAVSELMSLAGYIYLFFAEDYCSGVPFSRITPDGDIEYGGPTSTGEIYALAMERFDEAISRATAAGSPGMERLARLGKGRALLGLGRFDEAAEAVRTVPTDYRYSVSYSGSTERQVNGLYNVVNGIERLSAVNREGGNGIDYFEAFDAGDPRTPYEKDPRNGVGFDSAVEMFLQLKFTDRLAPMPVAEGREARLIEAEAALRAGRMADFAAIHGALRAPVGLPAVDATAMSPSQAVDFHFRERALTLWLQGHRLGDLRRLVRQYGRDAEQVFPSGAYTTKPNFPTFGSAVNFPVPFEETNNPNASGCIDNGA